MTGQTEPFESLSEHEKNELHIFNLLTSDIQSASLLEKIFDFFIKETVTFSETDHCFLISTDTNNIIGTITKETYSQVCDIICQRNNLKLQKEPDVSTVKSKKALEILQKLKKGRNEKAKTPKGDQNLELGNVISAVANMHPSLNIITIWELTIYQLWDTFSRLSNNNIYNIQSMSVAA